MRVTKKAFIGKSIAICCLILLVVFMCLLKTDTSISEWWTRNIARPIIWLGGHITGIFPFSFFELFIILSVIGILAWIVYSCVLISRRNFPRLLSLFMSVVIAVLSVVGVYIASASFGYNRAELDLYGYEGVMDFEDAERTVLQFVEEVNALGESMERDEEGLTVCPYTVRELNDLLIKEYEKLNGDYFGYYTPAAKGILNKTIMSELGILGVFFAPFGEPNYNPDENENGLPLTIAHEMAHAHGIMRENEADAVALYICINSDDDYIRYCAYIDCFSTMVDILSYYSSGKKYFGELSYMVAASEKVKADINDSQQPVSSYGIISKIGNWMNDLYLTLMGRDGTNDYANLPDVIYPDPGPVIVPDPGTGSVEPIQPPEIIINSYSLVQNLVISYCIETFELQTE